jgi:DNA-binding MarR family transcriptional regulator
MDDKNNTLPNRKEWQNSIPEERLAHLIKDARRAMERALQIRLVDHSVSFGHWSFLRILWEHDGLTQRELSDLAGTSAPTTFAAISAMESLGYVRRSQKESNKKNVYIHLTSKGRALRQHLVPLAEEINAVAISGLDPKDVLIARRVLAKIVENLQINEKGLQQSSNRRLPSTRALGRLLHAADR